MRFLAILVVLFLALPTQLIADDADLPPKAILPTRKYEAAVERAKTQYKQVLEQSLRLYISELEAAKAKSEGAEAAAIAALILKARKELSDVTTTWQVIFRGKDASFSGVGWVRKRFDNGDRTGGSASLSPAYLLDGPGRAATDSTLLEVWHEKWLNR